MNMKNKFPFYLSFLLALFLVSCGKIKPEGNIELKEVKVSDFNNINVEGKFRVFLVNSPREVVEVETYPNIFGNLDIEVNNETLKITENRSTKGVDFYNITIYSKSNPKKISISDSVEFNVSGEIKTDNLIINLKKNGKFIGALRTKKAEVEMQDTSLANFRGFTNDAFVKIKDTAGLIAPYWMVDHMKLNAQNGTYTEVNVKDSLKGEVQNTAKLLYYNNPVRAFKIGKDAKVENERLD